MYEEYSKQALPSKKYRELLGSALCVFNSNNSFIIENILRVDNKHYNWFDYKKRAVCAPARNIGQHAFGVMIPTRRMPMCIRALHTTMRSAERFFQSATVAHTCALYGTMPTPVPKMPSAAFAPERSVAFCF